MPDVPAAEYAESLELFERLVATNPAVERKGATMPYTSVNGHMFALLTKAGTLALRLPPDGRAAFVAKYKTEPCVQYGAVMKEYVEVPRDLLRETRELKKYFDTSYAYVAALKPKPAKRTPAKPAKKPKKV
jgi:TfoX/Sxy family transcriptional regulator of competence genes